MLTEEWGSPTTLEEVELGLRPSAWLDLDIPRCLAFIIYVHRRSCFPQIFQLDKTMFYEKTTAKFMKVFTVSAKLAVSLIGFVSAQFCTTAGPRAPPSALGQQLPGVQLCALCSCFWPVRGPNEQPC